MRSELRQWQREGEKWNIKDSKNDESVSLKVLKSEGKWGEVMELIASSSG